MPAPAFAAGGITPGSIGEVRHPLDPIGSVYVGGEEWSARSADDQVMPRGTPVRVVSREGLTVIVEADPSAASQVNPADLASRA